MRSPPVRSPPSQRRTIDGPGAPILFVRTLQDPAAIATIVSKEVWVTDFGVALTATGPLEERIHRQVYAGPRFGFLVMSLFGVAIGLAISVVLGRVIGAQLVGVTVYDPPTLAATTVLLTITAAIACWIPARRAAQVDPLVALRHE